MFEEEIFLYALTARPEDAKRFSGMFKPQWLSKSEYSPILAEIYAFTRKNGEPPSVVTLHKIFKQKDEEAYNLRYKHSLEQLQKIAPDRSEMIFTLDQAKGVAVTRSFLEMTHDQGFNRKQLDFDGTSIIKDIQSWLSTFTDTGDVRTMDLRKAVDALLDTAEFTPTNIRIPTNITPLDDWTGGGLRSKQVGIVLAPTGHGKSALLLVIAHKIASIELKKVWFITNELVLEEVAERELSKLTGKDLSKIMDDPTVAYSGLSRHWRNNLDRRFMLTEYTRETTTDDLESEMAKMANLYGWKPDVIVLDYMERMKPSLSGYRRDKEWIWMGAVAGDLVRLSKRHKLVIWTAAQVNRAGLSKSNEIDMSMAQGSIRHLQEMTAVISLRQEDVPNSDKVILELKSLKMRQSRKSSRSVKLECDLSRMDISNTVVEPLDDDEDEKDSSTPLQKQRRRKRSKGLGP